MSCVSTKFSPRKSRETPFNESFLLPWFDRTSSFGQQTAIKAKNSITPVNLRHNNQKPVLQGSDRLFLADNKSDSRGSVRFIKKGDQCKLRILYHSPKKTPLLYIYLRHCKMPLSLYSYTFLTNIWKNSNVFAHLEFSFFLYSCL